MLKGKPTLGGMSMSKERRRALGIFLSVTVLACNYSPLTQEILDRSILPARAEAASA
jgi:hypothetical protein